MSVLRTLIEQHKYTFSAATSNLRRIVQTERDEAANMNTLNPVGAAICTIGVIASVTNPLGLVAGGVGIAINLLSKSKHSKDYRNLYYELELLNAAPRLPDIMNQYYQTGMLSESELMAIHERLVDNFCPKSRECILESYCVETGEPIADYVHPEEALKQFAYQAILAEDPNFKLAGIPTGVDEFNARLEEIRANHAASKAKRRMGLGLPPQPPTAQLPPMRRDIGPTTRFGEPANGGAVDVPAFNLADDSNKFDWTRLNSEYDDFPHLLLLGKSGAGKSYLADRLVRFLDGYTLVITPKRKPQDFVGLQVVGVPYNYHAIYQAMKALEQLMIDREAEMNRTGDDNFTPINVILDELPISSAGCKDNKLDLLTPLKAVIRAARTSRIRLIILTQGAEVKALGIEGEGGLRDNLTYAYLKGFAEKYAKDNQIDISGLDRPCLIEDAIADTAFLQQFAAIVPRGLEFGASAPQSKESPQEPPKTPTREDLERIYSQSSAPHEVEDIGEESNSTVVRLRSAFPSWREPSIEVAFKVVEYLEARSSETFKAHRVKSGLNHLPLVKDATPDRFKDLLVKLSEAQFIRVNDKEEFTAIAPSEQNTTDDFDW